MDLEDLKQLLPPGTGRPLIRRQAAEFRANPALPAAIRTDVLGALELFSRDDPFNRTMTDMAAFTLGMLALSLHYSVGLSHRILRSWGGRGGLVSAGRATAILWRLRHYNLIVAIGPRESGKRVDFMPQPGMVEVYRRRLILLATAAGRLDPEIAAFAPCLRDDASLRAFMIAMAHGFFEAADGPFETELRQPTIERLTYRTHGSLILFCLLKAAYEADDERPGEAFPLSVGAIAESLGVSRSHVRGFVAALEREGFLERTGAATAEARLTPAFFQAWNLYQSTAYASFAAVIRRASDVQDRLASPGGKFWHGR
jgi:hypothetical protein